MIEGWLKANRSDRKQLRQMNEQTGQVLSDFQELFHEQSKRLEESEDEYRRLTLKLKESQQYEKTLIGMQQRINSTRRRYELEIAQLKQMVVARKSRLQQSSTRGNPTASRPETNISSMSSLSIPVNVTDSNYKPSLNIMSYEVAMDGFRRPVKYTHTGYIQYQQDVGKHYWSCCNLEADLNMLPKSVTSNIRIKPIAPEHKPQAEQILKSSPIKVPRRYSQYSK